MRRSIPAIQEFSDLAVDLKDVLFINRESNVKWHIISPISFDDAKKISKFPKEMFVEYIFATEIFGKIVEYVYEHSKTKASREIIKEEYKKLIEAYYDVMKE